MGEKRSLVMRRSIMLKLAAGLLLALVAGCAQTSPLVVRVTGNDASCTFTVNGEVFSEEDFTEARLQRLREAHHSRLLLDSGAETPYRCLGGAIFNLQRAGFNLVSVQVDGIPLPRR